LIYGEAGAGKTHLIGTAADDHRLRPVLIFDIEGGMVTLKDKPDIDVISVRSIKEVEEKYNTLYHSIKNEEIYYKTIGIDSLTELADLDMRSAMREAYNKNPETVHIDVPSPREWGIVRNHIRLIVRAFRDLPCHVVFTASLGIDAKENQPPKYQPGFAGKLVREVPGFTDIVGYYRPRMIGGEITRTLQVQGTDRVVAKDRTGALGGSVTDPTLSMMWDIIEGKPLTADAEE
jgi:phage nucleotide-binding protein